LPPGGGADLAALKLRVRTRSGNEGEVSQAVADAVLRALSRSIR
jgi:hypothetical protein